MSSTKISDYRNFDVSTMVFNDANKNEIKGAPGKPTIRTFRIPIRVRNQDGTVGGLVFAPEDVFTFGVSENKDQNSDTINGYTLPLTLFNKEGPTKDQQAFVETIKSIIEASKQHLLKEDTKKAILKPTLKYDGLEKLDKLLYFKIDENTGMPVEGRGPSMYPKLYTRKGDDGSISITTEFFNRDGSIDPLTLVGKYGRTTPALTFDSIFIGATMSIQVRVTEAEINLSSSGGRRLLPRPRADETLHVDSTLDQSTSQFPTLTRQYGIVEEFPRYEPPQQPESQSTAGQDTMIVDEEVSQPPPRAAPKKVVKAAGKR